MNLDVFTLNQIGGRKNIEDTISPSHYSPDKPPVFVVCDGVGGNRHGEVASAIASQCFYEVFSKQYAQNPKRLDLLLQKALKAYQDELAMFVEKNPMSANASTTLTLMVLYQNKAFIAWCGDSRIYHLRQNTICYQTKDHSLVAQLVARGDITETEAQTHPQRNVITRCLHLHTSINEIETCIIDNLQEGDLLLACTDGLLEQFTEQVFLPFFASWDAHKDYATAINHICVNKTKDNYSMYLVHLNRLNTPQGILPKISSTLSNLFSFPKK